MKPTRLIPALLLAALAACDTRPSSPAAGGGGGRGSGGGARPEGGAGPTQTAETFTPAPAPPTPEPPPTPAPRRFQPSLHGFRFINAFKGSPLPANLRGLERVLGSVVPDRFGLCGGMSAAAADYFLANLEVPADATPPTEGTPLYDYLYARQTDSFGAGFSVPVRILQGMAAPDTGPDGLEAQTAKELPAIRERLAAGELVTLCLVLGKADGRTKPWDNHQVLAYADATPTSPTSPAPTDSPLSPVLRIYDPNFPGDDEATLSFTATTDGFSGLRTARRRGAAAPTLTPVRGVFAGPYSKHTPTLGPAASPPPGNPSPK